MTFCYHSSIKDLVFSKGMPLQNKIACQKMETSFKTKIVLINDGVCLYTHIYVRQSIILSCLKLKKKQAYVLAIYFIRYPSAKK